MLVNEMIIFYYVVQLRSFSQAALKLKLSKSYISNHITHLEQDLNVRLLNRNTRQISLTREGELFYQHCQNIFEEAKAGYNVIAELKKQPAGTLKISAPPALALHTLKQPLAEFALNYPDVQLNIILDSKIEDIIGNGYDLVLRSAVLDDSNLIAVPIATFKSSLYASSSYLEKYGNIDNLNQLNEHKIAVYNGGNLIHELKFIKQGIRHSIAIEPYLQSNSLDMVMQMIVSGCCIGVLPNFMVKLILDKQPLIVCLPDYLLPDSKFYAIYPNKKFVPLRVKVFLELLKTYLSNI